MPGEGGGPRDQEGSPAGAAPPARQETLPLPFMMCVYMRGGIPSQLTATPRPALLFLKSLATGGDWLRRGAHQHPPPGAGPGPHCLVRVRLDAPEAGPGRPGTVGPGRLGARSGRGRPGSRESAGLEPRWPGRNQARSECHVSRNPLLTVGQHSAPPGPPSAKPPPLVPPQILWTLPGLSVLIRPTQPPALTPWPARSHPGPAPLDRPAW